MKNDIIIKRAIFGGFDRRSVIDYVNSLHIKVDESKQELEELDSLRSTVEGLKSEISNKDKEIDELTNTVNEAQKAIRSNELTDVLVNDKDSIGQDAKGFVGDISQKTSDQIEEARLRIEVLMKWLNEVESSAQDIYDTLSDFKGQCDSLENEIDIEVSKPETDAHIEVTESSDLKDNNDEASETEMVKESQTNENINAAQVHEQVVQETVKVEEQTQEDTAETFEQENIENEFRFDEYKVDLISDDEIENIHPETESQKEEIIPEDEEYEQDEDAITDENSDNCEKTDLPEIDNIPNSDNDIEIEKTEEEIHSEFEKTFMNYASDGDEISIPKEDLKEIMLLAEKKYKEMLNN